MIEKLEFYHGAAVVRIIEDNRCRSISKTEHGYLVNGDRLVFLKYTTKAHSPWRFTAAEDDLERLENPGVAIERCVVGFVCGGDGICSVPLEWVKRLLGAAPGWIAVKRVFSGCYSVTGPQGKLPRKIPLNDWPAVLFEEPRTNGR
jgi:hypothetical protein